MKCPSCGEYSLSLASHLTWSALNKMWNVVNNTSPIVENLPFSSHCAAVLKGLAVTTVRVGVLSVGDHVIDGCCYMCFLAFERRREEAEGFFSRREALGQ